MYPKDSGRMENGKPQSRSPWENPQTSHVRGEEDTETCNSNGAVERADLREAMTVI